MKRLFIIIFVGFITNNCLSQGAKALKDKVNDLFQGQQYDEAITYLNTIVVSDPKNVQVLEYLGYSYYMTENYKGSASVYEQILQWDPNNIAANQYLAIINANQNPVDAIGYLNTLIQINPLKSSYYRDRGDVFKKMKENDSAFACYKMAFQIDSLDKRNASRLSSSYIERAEFGKADTIINGVLEKDSLNVSFLKLKIASAYQAMKYSEAILPGEKLFRQGDNSIYSFTQLVASYFNLKMYTDCIRICDYIIEKKVANETIYFYEAQAYAKKHDYVKSNQLLQTCISMAISKTGDSYYYFKGINYESLGQFRKAVEQYDTSFYIYRSPLMLYNCGRIYEMKLKNRVKAEDYYRRYLRFTPENAEEVKAVEYVRERLKYWRVKK